MPPPVDDDWSDSDDELLSEVETSVLLGVPDGPLESSDDLYDAAVSRIGGLPAFLPKREPSFSDSNCNVCQSPMELLVQMWCPFEDSPMDRALYIWGCPRVGCQRTDGSVRAWRGLRYNEKYAVKLEKKLARKQARENEKAAKLAAEAEQKKNASKTNPFSTVDLTNDGLRRIQMSNASAASSPFGLGAQIFGGSFSPAPAVNGSNEKEKEKNETLPVDEESDAESESEESESEKSLLTAMASTTLTESPWKNAPTYPALYLSTVSEYLPPPPKQKLPPGAQVVDPSEADPKADKELSWMSEAYENSLDVDHVFERFTKRVAYEGEQCVRYELGGTPLPFSSDTVFQTLFPAPETGPLPVTKPDFKVVPPAPKRTFNASAVPPCPVCKAPRVFECQLMPNLINVLRQKEQSDKMTDEERRKAVENALKRGNMDERRGMEWGTVMVFSCEKDCCRSEDGKDLKDIWREEKVYIQWDV